MRKNILISTTRQWNPGDEFIMHGALNILTEIFGDDFNPIIYNRNPEVRGGASFRNKTRNFQFSYDWDRKSFKGKGGLHELFRIGHYDNSWKDDMQTKNIDLALFAGSPEWYGTRLYSMYSAIEKGDIPTIFLGLGAGDSVAFSKANPCVDRVLSKTKLIATRDKATENLLEKYGAIYVPCPALFAAKNNRVVTEVRKIGLIYATDRTLKGNNVSKAMHDYIVSLYSQLANDYEVALVCHYIDEVDQAREEFPSLEIYYSYDSKDYEKIYNTFDLVIGGRVHGIGMAASLGVPGLMIKHDSRSSTTDGFLAPSIEINTPYDEVKAVVSDIVDRIEDFSQKLISHKCEVMEIYKKLLYESGLDKLFQK